MERVAVRFTALGLIVIGAALIPSAARASGNKGERPRPQADRFQIQYYGYYPTCWRRFPAGWGCPLRECDQGAPVLAPKAGEPVAPMAPTETQPKPMAPSSPAVPPMPMPPSSPAITPMPPLPMPQPSLEPPPATAPGKPPAAAKPSGGGE